MAAFAEQLTAARKAAHMTQEQLADAVHVARNTISSWEHGRTQPDVETLRRLMQVLHVDFMNDASVAQASGSNDAADAEPGENETDAGKDPDPPYTQPHVLSKRKLLTGIAAAAVVLCACLLIFHPWNRESAVLDVHALETPVKMMQNTDVFEGDGRGWMFTFEILNAGGVPFKPESALIVFYQGERIDNKLQMSYEEMRPWMDADQLNKGDTPLHLLFGTNHTDCTHAVCIIKGVDQNGHRSEFSGTVEFSQEMQQ